MPVVKQSRKALARKRKENQRASNAESGGQTVVDNFILNSAVRNTILSQQFQQLVYFLSFALISYSLYHTFETRYHTHWYTQFLSFSSILIAVLLAWCVRSPTERGKEFRVAKLLTVLQCFVAAYLVLYEELQPGACLPLGAFFYGLVWAFWKTLMKNAMKFDSAQLKWRKQQRSQ
tara:strand:- start:313 stop:840 length:528 start_codon:yes stop_codon:yes gene_type:complete